MSGPFISSSIAKDSPVAGAPYRKTSWCSSRTPPPCVIPRCSTIPTKLTCWARWWGWLCVWIRGSDGVIVPEQFQNRLQIGDEKRALHLARARGNVAAVRGKADPGGQNGPLILV